MYLCGSSFKRYISKIGKLFPKKLNKINNEIIILQHPMRINIAN